MATELERQLEALKRTWDEQAEAWKLAQAACTRLGGARVLVPNEFLDRLDSLARSGPATPFLRPDGALRA